MYFMDPVYEEDLVKQNEARERKFQNLKSNITSDVAERMIAITKKYPGMPQSLSLSAAMAGANPEGKALEDIADKYAVNQADYGKKAWELASTDANGEYLYPEHQDMTLNISKALKGDAELWIWGMLALESFGEKIASQILQNYPAQSLTLKISKKKIMKY